MGEFLSRKGHTYKVEIFQESNTAFTVQELTFGANPLEIEWGATSKEDCICGSSATLTIESPGDRTYEDLYSIAVGHVRMDVSRDGALYWSGMLDTEFYEEPYSRYSKYDVQLTFSDLGILKRLPYDLTGTQSLSSMLSAAISRSGMHLLGTDVTMVSTTTDGGTSVMTGLAVLSENYIDEEGERTTWYDALEGAFQPLGLRLMQKGGKMYVFDLNGLYNSNAASTLIDWQSTDQVMGVDKVANKVTVNFSAYGTQKKSPEIKFTQPVDRTLVNLGIDSVPGSYPYYYTYKPNYGNEVSAGDYSFTAFSATEGSGLQSKHLMSRFMHIEPLFGAQEADCLAWTFVTGHVSMKNGTSSTLQRKLLPVGAPNWNNELMKCVRIPVMPMDEAKASKFAIRLTMELLAEMRYNPFESADNNNEGDNVESITKHAEEIRVPVSVTLYDSSDNILCHYKNSDALGVFGVKTLGNTIGSWVPGAHQNDCWLSYYDKSRKPNNKPCDGWTVNRQTVGPWPSPVSSLLGEIEQGQYMPYPSQGGYIEACVYTGVKLIDYKSLYEEESSRSETLRSNLRWLLYKAPKIDVVNKDVTWSEIQTDDIEYTGVLNEFASDGISIDTICGTSPDPLPSALGVYVSTATGMQVSTVRRAGKTNQVEKLLIGTIHSQFAERRTKLSGTCLHFCGFSPMYDEAQPGKKFICLGEVDRLVDDESEGVFVELRPDEYSEA